LERADGGGPAVGFASLGGLLRTNSRFNGRGLLFTPSRFSLVAQLVWTKPTGHVFTFGGELRLLRTSFNQLFGTTYNFSNANDFLANRPASVLFAGDLGSFGAATGGAPAGEREATQRYYIGFAQHEWTARPNLKLTYGVRYEYYSVLREKDDRAVVFDVLGGAVLPAGASFYRTNARNFLPRVAVAWAPKPDDAEIKLNRTVIGASFGMHSGPGVFGDLIKPIESDRLLLTHEGGLFPFAPGDLISAFAANEDDRRFQPSALARDYTTPLLVYKYDVSIKHDLVDRAAGKELFLVATYAGNQGRNLLLRNFTNHIVDVQTNPDPTRPAVITREFDFVRDGRLFKPFGEIEYRTSGGRARFDSLQLLLKGQAAGKSLTLFEAQYTLARSRGNTNGAEKTGVAGNTFDYDYDYGFNSDDVRHGFSLAAVFSLPCLPRGVCRDKPDGIVSHLLGNWNIGTIFSIQSGRPVDVRVVRPDVVYLDAEDRVFNSPAAGRRALANVPGGGASLNARRPDLVPGASIYLNEDRRFLNPAAFAIPAPGTFGNLPRGAVRAPSLKFVDLSLKKDFRRDEDSPRVLTFRVDISNIFNVTNFDRPTATLSGVLGTDAAANQLQPGQPFSAASAGDFGILNRTFKREQDLGASRQIQFGLAIKF
jgi:hypothetical protein